ncbi:unnamed protein product [Caenorhabditis angaria]|uniref:Uncharacterized protein n=1 Tax=Caenorhabditis angaria TaxID=860376 RepID=A0A9P1IU56_9PELO|nr:unnamed protein product [Caenorhabditis angaria]
MNFEFSCFLNNIIFILITISTLFVCKKNPAFESDAKVALVKPSSSSKQKAPPLGATSPNCVPPPKNVPISPAVKEEDTLAEVKSLKSDKEKIRQSARK